MSVFKGKTAIVTGAGSGIGRALALRFADEGARVLITDLIEERVDNVVEEIKAKGMERRRCQLAILLFSSARFHLSKCQETGRGAGGEIALL